MTAQTKGEADGRVHAEQRAELVRLGCLQEKTFPCDLSHRSSAYRLLLVEVLSTRTRYPEIEIDYPEHRSIHLWGEPRLIQEYSKLMELCDHDDFRDFFESNRSIESLRQDRRFPVVSNAVKRIAEMNADGRVERRRPEVFELFSRSPVATHILQTLSSATNKP